jgi:peptidoglycan hydrolase CwlO-like protein
MKRYFIAIFVFVSFFTFWIPKATFSFDCVADLTNNSSYDQKQFCQNELNQLLNQVTIFENQLKEQVKQTGTIKGDVAYLTGQINALKAKVKSRAVAIATLKVSINEKSSKIKTLSQKIESEKESLGQLIRNTNEADNENFIHLIFSDGTLSDFYSDVESYASIKEAIKKSVDAISGIKTETEVQKADLEKKQDAETDAKAELESAQKKVAQSEAEKKKLLALSKQKESDYQKVLAEKKTRADKIRNALFSLAGVAKGIPFGTALLYANEAKGKTGIDPAFLLAILTQESNLGSNVGKCYLTDSEGEKAGYGVNRATGKVWTNLMKPTRDIEPFLEITKKLNFNPFDTTVSCPIAGVKGYGGAMGPAQFIPSTWKIFIDRLQSSLGHYPNPWEPEDAFMASSMYLTDLGAVGTSVSAQSKAACRYYGSGGSSCSYSRSVINLKNKIQSNIDLLSY